MTTGRTWAHLPDGSDGEDYLRLLDARELEFHELAAVCPVSMFAGGIRWLAAPA